MFLLYWVPTNLIFFETTLDSSNYLVKWTTADLDRKANPATHKHHIQKLSFSNLFFLFLTNVFATCEMVIQFSCHVVVSCILYEPLRQEEMENRWTPDGQLMPLNHSPITQTLLEHLALLTQFHTVYYSAFIFLIDLIKYKTFSVKVYFTSFFFLTVCVSSLR